MREIKADIESLNKEATTLFEAKDYEGAQNKLDEIDKLEQAYKVAEKLCTRTGKWSIYSGILSLTRAYARCFI